MKIMDVIIVRIYVTESSHLLKTIVNYLKTETEIRGLSVFRAISGFGDTKNHNASLIDFSLDLPLAIEFFDSKEKIMPALEHLSTIIKHEHIVFWNASTND
jgi:PII-like signaling protein